MEVNSPPGLEGIEQATETSRFSPSRAALQLFRTLALTGLSKSTIGFSVSVASTVCASSSPLGAGAEPNPRCSRCQISRCPRPSQWSLPMTWALPGVLSDSRSSPTLRNRGE